MKNPQFNEDHPDYERIIKEALAGNSVEEGYVVAVMQLTCPVDFLLYLLHNEIRGLKHQIKGVAGMVVLALVWAFLPMIGMFINQTVPEWYVTLPLSLFCGMVAGYQVGTMLNRWRRYQGFIKPAHSALHEFLDQAQS